MAYKSNFSDPNLQPKEVGHFTPSDDFDGQKISSAGLGNNVEYLYYKLCQHACWKIWYWIHRDQ